ncbi:hypothetical protein BpHYR1_013248 [Brachionus plicatilis]|uniref:Uncharacterized protein n=1 Tax=Brachionus plicatilis TaxID=10195 RepID=A0A3M7S0Q4_BRAPC|nr:hypothetical protein BpHYR1_013248 [Brachionus plicatilis]
MKSSLTMKYMHYEKTHYEMICPERHIISIYESPVFTYEPNSKFRILTIGNMHFNRFILWFPSILNTWPYFELTILNVKRYFDSNTSDKLRSVLNRYLGTN